MRTETKIIYQFDELPTQEAKARAIEWARGSFDYAWGYDNRRSLDEFRDYVQGFDVSYARYDHEPFSCEITIDLPEDIEALRGQELAYYIRLKWGKFFENGLIGFIRDFDLLAPLEAFLLSPEDDVSYEYLLRRGVANWLQSCHEDFLHFFSDENLADIIRVNRYEFDERGVRV